MYGGEQDPTDDMPRDEESVLSVVGDDANGELPAPPSRPQMFYSISSSAHPLLPISASRRSAYRSLGASESRPKTGISMQRPRASTTGHGPKRSCLLRFERRPSTPSSLPALRERQLSVSVSTCPPSLHDAPTSPHASVFPIGPTTLYPITSRTTRTCSAVSGCSYISVFIAGNTYVGVERANARSTDVCAEQTTPCVQRVTRHTVRAHTLPRGCHSFREQSSTTCSPNRVQSTLCPPISSVRCAKSDPQSCTQPGTRGSVSVSVPVPPPRNKNSYGPFVFIGPHPGACIPNGLDVEKRRGCFSRHHLHLHVPILGLDCQLG